MIIDSLIIITDNSIRDSVNILKDQTILGTPLIRILILTGIIIIASFLYRAYDRWIVPESVKRSSEYKENKFKDIDIDVC